MSGEFSIPFEREMPGTPEELFQAITRGTDGWLWPMEYEAREGGTGPFGGVVVVWDPPHRLVTRVDGEDGWFNQLEYAIEARPDGGSYLRYVHSGVLAEDWDNQYDQAKAHTTFYIATLATYVSHFLGRPAVHIAVEPEGAQPKDTFARFVAGLGLGPGAGEGSDVSFDVPGIGRLDSVVDYRDDNFLGLRTADSLIRFFGRSAWGGSVGFAIHDFTGRRSPEELETAWKPWFEARF